MNSLGDVLITGGAGFFGREFVRFILQSLGSDESRIIVYSRDEAKHAAMRMEFKGEHRLRFMIGDIRDLPRLTRAMNGVNTVIHAAALKRIEVGQYCPSEMVQTNINGTQNVVDAALACGVRRTVLLSTDKACRPVSPYGYTKALAEAVFRTAGPKFGIVRYGNVSGSTGSIIPVWREMISKGARSVPVTDPNCTRFWMWPHQAVELVFKQALAADDTVMLTPDLPAYRVGDLAGAFGISMNVTGLPAWEKKHEQMIESGPTSAEVPTLNIVELKERLKIMGENTWNGTGNT